ncbi:MAG: VanW family protein [Clostridia bacterium]|nr:VanW family protein [Clostridia bacterium]
MNKRIYSVFLILIILFVVFIPRVNAEDEILNYDTENNNVEHIIEQNEELNTTNINSIDRVLGEENQDITIEYNYNESDNTVMVIVNSSIGFKNTKVSWSLSNDKTRYSKKFENNKEYTTIFTLKDGTIINKSINITQIKDIEVRTEYQYNEADNTVTVKVISNVPMKENKVSWKLSSDKKVYSKTFDTNKEYSTIFTQNTGKTIYGNINITQVKDIEVRTEYQYNEEDNTVTAKVISNVPMKENKVSWNLSSDKKVYSKTFDTNQEYATLFTQNTGKTIYGGINITQVKDIEVRTEYQYNEVENTVTAKVISNVPMKENKVSWKLSSDKKVYSKTFDTNQEYATLFTQNIGNTTYGYINITQIKDIELTTEYEYDSYNNILTAKVNSNVPMKDNKCSWTLSEDKRVYTKEFNKNNIYNTPFTQSNGKVVDQEIIINQIQDIKVDFEINYNSTKTYATVIVNSNYPMKDNKCSWTLSEDKKTYTKTYSTNMNYTTQFTQTNGIVNDIKLNINQIREFKISVSYDYSLDKKSVNVIVTSNFKMNNTKPTWNLSGDRRTFTKNYTDNISYMTTFTDEYERKKDVYININEIYKGPELISEATLISYSSGYNRNVNLSLATGTINGTVIGPGGVFSWVDVVGQASASKGYLPAAIFVGDDVVDGYGGGVCQVSSTLYQAARDAGMTILERHDHSMTPSYTTLGNDAAVAYPYLNFAFQNPYPYSILIEMSSDGGAVNCKLYRI